MDSTVYVFSQMGWGRSCWAVLRRFLTSQEEPLPALQVVFMYSHLCPVCLWHLAVTVAVLAVATDTAVLGSLFRGLWQHWDCRGLCALL